MKNAYNTSAYGSFAYVYDIFMEHIIKKVAEVQQLIKRKSQKKTSVTSSDNNI